MGGITLGDGTNTVTLNSGTIAGDLTGGANADTFNINGGTLTGTVVGGGGDDHLDMAGLSTALTIALSGALANGFDGTVTDGGLGAALMFTGINEVTGGSMTDTLQGLGTAGTFTLGAVDTYANGQTLTFNSLENMVGGAGVDTFTVNGAHTGGLSGGAEADTFTITDTLTGIIMGDAGDDTITLGAGGMVMGAVIGGADGATLSYAGRTDPVSVELNALGVGMGMGAAIGFAGAATGIVMGFGNITAVIGTGGTDTLTGVNEDATFTVDGTGNTYESTNTLSFAAFENLTGGSMVDTFTINAAHTGDLSGGGRSRQLQYQCRVDRRDRR